MAQLFQWRNSPFFKLNGFHSRWQCLRWDSWKNVLRVGQLRRPASASLSSHCGTDIGISSDSDSASASAVRAMYTSNRSSTTSTSTSSNKISELFLQSSSERASTAGISNIGKGAGTSVAAVALILRINLNHIHPSKSNQGSFADLPQYFDDVDHLQSWCQKNQDSTANLPLDILLIKRQVHPGDPWSGDIALPGK